MNRRYFNSAAASEIRRKVDRIRAFNSRIVRRNKAKLIKADRLKSAETKQLRKQNVISQVLELDYSIERSKM